MGLRPLSIFYFFIARTDFRRRNLTFIDVWFRRLKSIVYLSYLHKCLIQLFSLHLNAYVMAIINIILSTCGDCLRGFVKLKKFKNPRKTRKWVGGTSPKSDFYFFWKFYVFLYFLCCFHVPKRLKKMDKEMGGRRLTNTSFSRIFFDFFKLDKSPKVDPSAEMVKHRWPQVSGLSLCDVPSHLLINEVHPTTDLLLVSGRNPKENRCLNVRPMGIPGEPDTLKQCWFNVGPPSATLAQLKANIVSLCRVCWDRTSQCTSRKLHTM